MTALRPNSGPDSGSNSGPRIAPGSAPGPTPGFPAPDSPAPDSPAPHLPAPHLAAPDSPATSGTPSAPQASRPQSADSGPPPSVAYWHVWTDETGVSRQTRCCAGAFVSRSINPPAAPQWLNPLAAGETVVLLTVQPSGWTGVWHENPKPQWIIPLSGRWFVQTMDGHRVEMGPGEMSFGEDQGTRPDAEGRRGHLSGTVGEDPAVLMIVQMQSPPHLASPCRFA